MLPMTKTDLGLAIILVAAWFLVNVAVMWGDWLNADSMTPIRPIWPGFAINTAFYAGVLWLVICGVLALLRTIRRLP